MSNQMLLEQLFGDDEIPDEENTNLFLEQNDFNIFTDNFCLKNIQEMGAKQCGLVKYPTTSITSTDHNLIEIQSEPYTATAVENSGTTANLYANYDLNSSMRNKLIQLLYNVFIAEYKLQQMNKHHQEKENHVENHLKPLELLNLSSTGFNIIN